jgi:hypothetical protein
VKSTARTKTLILCAACFTSLLAAGPAIANITVYNGADFYFTLADGAFITDSPLPPSDFAYRHILEHPSNTDGTVSGTRPLSDIPVFDIGSTLYFGFMYDAQEVMQISGAADPELTIDSIAVSVDGIDIWQWTTPIVLNPNNGLLSYTTTYYGAGGDLELYLPVSLFYGYGLTGSSLLTFTSTVESNDNGHEEWIVNNSPGMLFFDSDDPIDPVPAPGALLLSSLGAGIVAILRRHRATRNQLFAGLR